VIEQFKTAFDSADVPGVVKLFAPDAVFLGTVSPKLATKTAEIDTYFFLLTKGDQGWSIKHFHSSWLPGQ
jgi:hypothetical protein